MTSACRRVLVVEDDPILNQTVSDRLEAEGYDVVRAWDGPAAVAAYGEHAPHLVVLDVMLPGYDGHEVCRRIQADRPVPILMLTARGDEADVVVGLGVGGRGRLPHQAVPDAGARRPGRCASAPSRARRRARRPPCARARRPPRGRRRPAGVARPGGGPADSDRVDLLLCLAATPGAVVSRDRLMAEVWGWPGASGTRTVDSHVKGLRGKVGVDRIRTVHGVGYALETGSPE